MKNIKQEAQIWLQLLTFIAIWVALLLITNTPLAINVEALKKLPDVVLIYVILDFIFKKWVWRIPFLQEWLIRFPDLEGTWEGTLQTTWTDPKTGKIPPPIPLVLVIKQTFDSISCVMHTQESSSYSSAALISEQEGNGIKILSYNYTNTPEADIRDRSVIHDGAAKLTIVNKPKRILKGEYWTSRKTTGAIQLKFKTRKLEECFPDRLKNK